MGQLDQAARYSAKAHDAPGHLRWLWPALSQTRRFTRWLDARTLPFPGAGERICDTVAEWLRPSWDLGPLATVVEYLVKPSQAAVERVVRYTMDVRDQTPYQAGDPRVPYDVVGILVHLTGPPQPEDWVMRPADAEGKGLAACLKVVTLSLQSASQVLADVARGETGRCVLPWIVLMQGGADPVTMEEWLRQAKLEPEAWKRADYGALAKVFATLTEGLTAWEQALEGWPMEESPVINQWISVGEQRGLARGRQEGQLLALRTNVSQAVQARFQLTALPAEVAQRLEQQTDLNILQRWFQAALKAKTLDEFQAALSVG